MLPTLTEDLQEAVGDAISTDQGGIATARRRPRQFTLTIPIYGPPSDPNPYLSGYRMRRQMRAMMENSPLRLEALYFAFNPDPDLNGWMIVGSGQIKYVDGGPTFGQFQMELDTAYRVGSMRTHRDARRVELYDRRLGSTPRDYKGLVFGTDFAAVNALSLTYLPVNVSNVRDGRRSPVASVARAGIDGPGSVVSGTVHASALSFEQAEADQLKGQVVVWDRQGFTAPSGTLAGDTDPQSASAGYGWEEVYGPDQPLTASDCVVVGNGLCRVRYVAAAAALAVDRFVAGSGYVEQGRLTLWDSVATDVYTQHTQVIAANNGAYGTLLEWTGERAVVTLGTQRTPDDFSTVIDTYITLQRGWLGPRVESYVSSTQTQSPGVQLRWTPNTVSAMQITGPSGALTPANPAGPTFASVLEPWVLQSLATPAVGSVGNVLVAIQGLSRWPTYNESSAYGGVARSSIAVAARFNETQVTGGTRYGYVSLHLGFTVAQAAGVFANSLADYSGPRDQAAAQLLDSQSVPTLIER